MNTKKRNISLFGVCIINLVLLHQKKIHFFKFECQFVLVKFFGNCKGTNVEVVPRPMISGQSLPYNSILTQFFICPKSAYLYFLSVLSSSHRTSESFGLINLILTCIKVGQQVGPLNIRAGNAIGKME